MDILQVVINCMGGVGYEKYNIQKSNLGQSLPENEVYYEVEFDGLKDFGGKIMNTKLQGFFSGFPTRHFTDSIAMY